MQIKNASIGQDVSWHEDGLTFIEMNRQEYAGNNCVFSAGFVEGHAIDTMYLKWQKEGDSGGMLLLTPDELQALAWVAGGALWSELYRQREIKEADNE